MIVVEKPSYEPDLENNPQKLFEKYIKRQNFMSIRSLVQIFTSRKH